MRTEGSPDAGDAGEVELTCTKRLLSQSVAETVNHVKLRCLPHRSLRWTVPRPQTRSGHSVFFIRLVRGRWDRCFVHMTPGASDWLRSNSSSWIFRPSVCTNS